jgi:glycerol-3-phosphate O-acyltransferase
MEKAASPSEQGSPGNVPGAAVSRVLLLFAATPTEDSVLRGWIERSDHSGATLVHAGRGELGRALAGDGAWDPEIVPLRVAWLAPERGGVRRARVREVLTLSDPRSPSAAAHARIAGREPDRCRVVVGEAARASDLRRRFATGGGERFESFVERQGLLAVERAERKIIGGRYKVPRLVREDITASARFQTMVAGLAAEQGRGVEEVGSEAAAALDELVAGQSRLAIDAWDHFGRWVGRAYTLDVDTSRLEELRRLGERNTLVFLPSHRSYMDTLVLRPVLHRHGFSPNHVLGGNNLDFWPIGPVARRNGYVFIRRSMKDAPVYKAVLREYLGYLLRKRFNVECYIEGGRTRTGKLRRPRYGILAFLVDAFRESGTDDVLLVPVSVVYDQLHEVGAMAAEERGARKQAEGLRWILDYTRAQGRPFGAVHVTFADPLSLAEALASDDGVPKIAFEVLNRINGVTPITASAVVALALLGGHDRAITLEEGRALVRPLLEYADARGLPRVAGVEIGRSDVVQRTLALLVREGVVTEFADGTEPVYEIAPGRHVEAAFYRNNVVHHFVTRAIAELALLALADGSFAADGVPQEALRLRDLLKFELPFAHTRTFADEVRAEASILAPGWENGPAEVRAGLERARFLIAHRVVGSFLEAYQLVADRLVARDPNEPVEQEAFLRECLGVGRQYVMLRRLKTPESVSRELFAGALRLAANRDLVDPGGEELRERRAAFAAELHEAVRRVDAIRALAQHETGGEA